MPDAAYDLVHDRERIRSLTHILAQTVRPTTVRSLDAVHLGTALRLGAQLTSFVTYDKRLADAAMAAGLPVDMPA